MSSGDEARRRRYLRGRSIAMVIAVIPLLSMYGIIHTPWLRPYEPESREALLLLLLGIPFGWFGAVTVIYRRVGPLLFRMECPGCGARLDDRAAAGSGRCRACT